MQVNKKIVAGLLLAILAFSSLVVLGQQPKKVLMNEDVIKMVKEGLPDNVIVSTIQQFPSNYDVSPDALIQMKRQGVSGIVLTAVLEAEKLKNSKPTEVATSSESKTPQKIKPVIRNDFVFELNVCQSSGGDSVTCWLLITNKAQERELVITASSNIVDNLGGQYSVMDMWIGKNAKQVYLFETAVGNTLIPQIGMAAVLKFQNVKPNATSLSVLRIACRSENATFNVDFRDIPITPKPQPSPIPKVELQQEKQKAEDLERYKIKTREGAEPVSLIRLDGSIRILPKGTTSMVSNGNPVYRIPFKYQVKHFSLDVRRNLDLCTGTITVGKDYLEIRTDSSKSQLGGDCNSNTYNLTKDNIQKMKDTFDSHWYDFNPTNDHLYIKFITFENNGKDKKKREFYLFPPEALIKFGTRTPTLTGRVLVCPDCPAIVCPNCREQLIAMKNLLDEFYSKEANTNIQKPTIIN
jgi:hypothetical protein